MHPSQKAFFPTDKPRSWVIAVSAALIGLVFGSLSFVGYYFESHILFNIGRIFFVVCWFVVFLMTIMFLINSVSGRYRKISPSKWSKRPW